jgi:hypothetical protein
MSVERSNALLSERRTDCADVAALLYSSTASGTSSATAAGLPAGTGTPAIPQTRGSPALPAMPVRDRGGGITDRLSIASSATLAGSASAPQAHPRHRDSRADSEFTGAGDLAPRSCWHWQTPVVLINSDIRMPFFSELILALREVFADVFVMETESPLTSEHAIQVDSNVVIVASSPRRTPCSTGTT